MNYATYREQTTTGANIVQIRAPSQCFCHESHSNNLSPLSLNNGGGTKTKGSPTPQGFVGSQLIANSLGLNSLNQIDPNNTCTVSDNM